MSAIVGILVFLIVLAVFWGLLGWWTILPALVAGWWVAVEFHKEWDE